MRKYKTKIPRPKRGWHIAQKDEWCPMKNTAIFGNNTVVYGFKEGWDYNPIYGGYKNHNVTPHYPARAIRNHLRNENSKT